MHIYDCVIVGGGPSGLSAAIYLARFLRSVLIVDKKQGRSNYPQINENYMGFPKGISSIELCKLARRQAMRFGAQYTSDEISTAQKREELFYLKGKKADYVAKTILIATGVTDLFPKFTDYKSYVGKSLFWCITCDGYKTRNRNVMIVGHDDEAVCTCMQFLTYTPNLTFVTNCKPKELKISATMLKRLEDANIPFYDSKIETVTGRNGYMRKVTLENGKKIEVDYMFNQQGAKPNNLLAKQLELDMNEQGYIQIGLEQRTSMKGVYAAGDVTRLFSHQIVTAAHEGSMAAQAINYDLYGPEKKM